MKIVSLLPSATEIVCALGLQDSLVGVTHECDYLNRSHAPGCANPPEPAGMERFLLYPLLFSYHEAGPLFATKG